MNKLFVILILPFVLNAQITENFNSFPGHATNNTVLLGRFDPTNFPGDSTDHSPASNTLTRNGNVGDSLLVSSMIYDGGVSEYFDGTGDYWSIADASATDLELGAAWTVQGWVKRDNVSPTHVYVAQKLQGSGSYPGWIFRYDNTLNKLRVWLSSGAGGGSYAETQAISNYGKDMSDGSFHHLYASFNSGSIIFYYDGDSLTTVTGKQTPGATTAAFRIAADEASGQYKQYHTFVKIDTVMLSKKLRKEDLYLAEGWFSKNGGVTRSSFGFNQGIVADTVYYPVSASTLSGTVKAWSATGTPNLLVFNKAGDTQTIAVTTTPTTYDISSITFASADSVYFATTSTVYIDDVVLSNEDDGQDKGFKELNKKNRLNSLLK